MAVVIQQPGLAGLYGKAAAISKGAKEARAAQEQAARKQEIREQRQYQQNVKMLDAQLDLEMYERSKRWEIEKMELRSRGDFEREERFRQRKLDEQRAKLDALEKAYDNGRGVLDKESYDTAVLRETTGVAFPFKRPLTEQQMFKEAIAKKMREALSSKAGPVGADTSIGGRIRVISPSGQSGTIEASEIQDYRNKGFTIVGEAGTPAAKKQDKYPKSYKGIYPKPSYGSHILI